MANLYKFTGGEVLNKVLNDDGELKCNNTVTQLSSVTVADSGVIATMQDDIALMKADIDDIRIAIQAVKATTDKLDACVDESANVLNVSTS